LNVVGRRESVLRLYSYRAGCQRWLSFLYSVHKGTCILSTIYYYQAQIRKEPAVNK